MLRFGVLVVACAAVVLGMAGSVLAGPLFGEPVNLGAPVNDSSGLRGMCISRDGLSLYFSSNRPGGLGGYDLWVATRQTTADAWGEPVNLSAGVNSPQDEWDPGISADGLSLYFCVATGQSATPLNTVHTDIWLATRRTTAEPFGSALNLRSALTKAGPCEYPSISADGLSLYFSGSTSYMSGLQDLWLFTRPSIGADWGEPVRLDALNSAQNDAAPDISADGRTLLFMSTRPRDVPTVADFKLWMATRRDPAGAFGTPVKLPMPVNQEFYSALFPSLSADSSTLYFCSDRPGGLGDMDIWQASVIPDADLNDDERVDLHDFGRMARAWRSDDTTADIAPPTSGDGAVDYRDLSALTKHWLQDAALPIYITWLGHASVKIVWSDQVIYVDPVDIVTSPHDATLLLVTHSHSDHYAPASIDRVAGPAMQVIAPVNVATGYPRRQSIAPGQAITLPTLQIIGVAAYNINKSNHPKANNWVGFIVQIGSRRIYCAGDTDLTPEMKALTDIDVAFLPAGGTYTMTAAEAADATKYFMPGLAIPYHWGRSVGTLADAQLFVQKAACPARVMTKGETISSVNWNQGILPSAPDAPIRR